MKKLIFLSAALVVASLSWAQGQGGGQRPTPPSSEEMIKKATEELSLTDEQVQQWTEIHKNYEADMKDRSKAQATRQKMEKELEATLTDKQLEKFKKMRGNRKPSGRGN
jgi:coenzyme F420-reducing hydrogenase alpha subunit